MRVASLLVLVLAAACGGTPGPQPLAATLVEATVEQRCPSDGGARCGRPSLFLNAPHCGHDVTALEPPSEAVTVDTAEPAASLVGVWEVRTASLDDQGLREAFEPRRAVLTSGRPEALVYAAFPSQGALYRLSATGRLTPLADAGDVEADDAGAMVFSYALDTPDGGALRIVERHRVAATWQVQATVRDHSGEPFYGCCAHVGPATPLVLLALLVLLRRRG